MKDKQARLMRSLEAFADHQGLKTIKLSLDRAGNYKALGRPRKALPKALKEVLCSSSKTSP